MGTLGMLGATRLISGEGGIGAMIWGLLPDWQMSRASLSWAGNIGRVGGDPWGDCLVGWTKPRL